jgi:DNA-directed RNA polymerase specialized sigma24 family protein
MPVPLPEHLPRRARLDGLCRRRRNVLPAPDLPRRSEHAVHLALVGTLADLTPRRRQVLVLAALGGLGPVAIARIVGLPVDVVGCLLRDAVDEVVNRLVA